MEKHLKLDSYTDYFSQIEPPPPTYAEVHKARAPSLEDIAVRLEEVEQRVVQLEAVIPQELHDWKLLGQVVNGFLKYLCYIVCPTMKWFVDI